MEQPAVPDIAVITLAMIPIGILVPVLIASWIGGMLGVVGGFVGGRTNTAIMRTMDVFYAFPSVLLAVAIAGAMGGMRTACRR